MSGSTTDVWEAMATARTIRRFTDEPVDDDTLAGARGRHVGAIGSERPAWRFVVLRSPETRAVVAAQRPTRSR